MRVIAIDPGVSTGIAVVESTTMKIETMFTTHNLMFLDKIEATYGNLIIYENYFLGNPAFIPTGIEVIGAIRYYANLHTINLIKQEPSVPAFMVKRFDLKNIRTKDTIHSKEALFHALYYLRAKINSGEEIRAMVKEYYK